MKSFIVNGMIDFSLVKADAIVEMADDVYNFSLADIDRVLTVNEIPTIENFLDPLDQSDNLIEQIMSPIEHINSVHDSEEFREPYARVQELSSAYYSKVSFNKGLYDRFVLLRDNQDLSPPVLKAVNDVIESFERSGIDLPKEEQEKLVAIQMEQSQLLMKFSQNILDATDGWFKHITNEEELAGLPELLMSSLRQNAEEKELDGFVITLNPSCTSEVMKYAENEKLRKEIYFETSTRASDIGANAGTWDNADVITKIIENKFKSAKILGCNNPAELSVARKMTKDTKVVTEFLENLRITSIESAREEFIDVQEYAEVLGHKELNVWDYSYYTRRMKEEKFDINNELIKQYFPLSSSLEQLFELTNTLYGITFKRNESVNVWNDTVEYYDIYDSNDEKIAGIYFDFYARSKKRGGAWMNNFTTRMYVDGKIQNPLALVVCNFSSPTDTTPTLLNHHDLETLFHEVGHALHHTLTKVTVAGVSGIAGVEWDAVELPSQIMENWCWNKESLKLISSHYETGESLPDVLIDKMINAKNFCSALSLLRQLEFSIFDFELHMNFGDNNSIQDIAKEVQEKTVVYDLPEFCRFPNTFSHIFGGGYGAGYYSYLWARALSDDAFSKFEENGIFDRKTGLEFKENILEVGGSRTAMESFVAFRGREPKIDALLKNRGIA